MREPELCTRIMNNAPGPNGGTTHIRTSDHGNAVFKGVIFWRFFWFLGFFL